MKNQGLTGWAPLLCPLSITVLHRFTLVINNVVKVSGKLLPNFPRYLLPVRDLFILDCNERIAHLKSSPLGDASPTDRIDLHILESPRGIGKSWQRGDKESTKDTE
jgi:hypothetical protein